MNTIKTNKEIEFIIKNGILINTSCINFFVINPTNNINGNVAFIAGKKNGNAVWRTKSRRILREVYRKLNINKNYKILMIANKSILSKDINKIIKEVNSKLIKYKN